MVSSQAPLSNLDFQQARIKFILFKSKLRSILYGGIVDDSILSPRDNSLGQWLYSTALQRYAHLPEVKEIEKINLSIIGIARELIALYNKGKIDEARTGLTALEQSEEELITLLSTLQDKVAA